MDAVVCTLNSPFRTEILLSSAARVLAANSSQLNLSLEIALSKRELFAQDGAPYAGGTRSQ